MTKDRHPAFDAAGAHTASASLAPVWQPLGASIRGAAHTRAGRPNQDAIAWRAPANPHEPAVLAIADGHGSAAYVRSQNGAKLAVQVAIDFLYDFARLHDRSTSLTAVNRLASERLPRDLVLAWRTAVDAHLTRHPFTDAERALSADRASSDPCVAYGATLLCVLATPAYLLLLQLGDGDMLLVDRAQNVSRPPLPHDPRLLGNQTTSLCGQSAWRDVRTVFQPLTTAPPSLILLATDGYANSFADESGFFAAAADLGAILAAKGKRTVVKNLPKWLAATSSLGSGDDITLGLLYHP